MTADLKNGLCYIQIPNNQQNPTAMRILQIRIISQALI